MIYLGGIALFFAIAWWSGEHHAERAKRIVENNRVERRKKWHELNRELRLAKSEIKRLKDLLKGAFR